MQGGNELIPLSKMKVTRDLLSFKFVLKSDIDPASIKYNVVFKSWTSNSFELFVNFTDPLQIS